MLFLLGPIALKAADVLKGANITSHPSVKSQLEDGVCVCVCV